MQSPKYLGPLWSRCNARQLLPAKNLGERRKIESSRIREKYPDRVPVIVDKAERSDVPNIDKFDSIYESSDHTIPYNFPKFSSDQTLIQGQMQLKMITMALKKKRKKRKS